MSTLTGATGKAGFPAAAAAATTECRSVGLPPHEKIGPLLSLLRGLCYRYGSFQYYDVVLRAPLQGGSASTAIRLTRSTLPDQSVKDPFAEALPAKWSMRVESLPLRIARRDGGGATTVSVREVLESGCYSNMTPEFWQAMGAKLDYEVVRKGNEYCCVHDDHEIKVQVVQVLPLQQQGRPETAAAGRDVKYIVDATLHVPEEARLEGQKALESFGVRLAQHVTLSKAEVGFA